MPYVSKAELERARWTKILETLAYICWTDGCSLNSAHQQLCSAGADGMILTKWEDEHPVGRLVAGPRFRDDVPPKDRAFWQKIPLSKNTMLDPYPRQERERALLLLRFDVQSLWPPSAMRRPQTRRTRSLPLPRNPKRQRSALGANSPNAVCGPATSGFSRAALSPGRCSYSVCSCHVR